MFFQQKINLKVVLSNLGLLLHVPGIMALITVPVAFFFREYFAISPLFVTAFLSVVVGQILYHLFRDETPIRLRDGMVTAAVGWLFAPLIGAIPMYWIATKLLA